MRQWAVITGGGKRLGRQLALTLAAKGWNCLIHYLHSADAAGDVVSSCRELGVEARAVQADLAVPQEAEKLAASLVNEKLPVKLLINNVGNYLIKEALKTTNEELLSLFQTNVQAPFILSRTVAPLLFATKGSIINIGTSGLYHPHAYTKAPIYELTKQALFGLTRALAAEMRAGFVRVNMVSPGQLENSVDLPPTFEKLPMGRPGYLVEIARVVAFLAEDENSYITGQNIEVDGGLYL